jgi:hypothetical protein
MYGVYGGESTICFRFLKTAPKGRKFVKRTVVRNNQKGKKMNTQDLANKV